MRLFGNLMTKLFPPPKQSGTSAVTMRGEQVKSYGEQKIAEFLDDNHIRYEYKRPIEVGIWIFNEELCWPDFYLPAHDIYIEYWGMLVVEDGQVRRDYRAKMAWKLEQYARYDLKLISIYPDDRRHLDFIIRKRFNELTGKGLPKWVKQSQPQFSKNDYSPVQKVQMDRSGPACPKCGSPMVKRMAKQGPNAGKPFWGCAQWSKTKCSGIIKI